MGDRDDWIICRRNKMNPFAKVTLGVFLIGLGVLFGSAGLALMKVAGVF